MDQAAHQRCNAIHGESQARTALIARGQDDGGGAGAAGGPPLSTAGFRLRACFFICVTINVSVKIGAKVHLLGPPLHGQVTVDLEVASVTIAFGPAPHAPLAFLNWNVIDDAASFGTNGLPLEGFYFSIRRQIAGE